MSMEKKINLTFTSEAFATDYRITWLLRTQPLTFNDSCGLNEFKVTIRKYGIGTPSGYYLLGDGFLHIPPESIDPRETNDGS